MVVKIGTFGNDLLLGTNNADTLQGSFGDDTLRGYKGNDLLVGGGDDDTLEGGKGSDSLYGDAGDDHLDGGAGVDTAVFNTAGDVDVSLSFGIASSNLGEDTLELVENVTTGSGDDSISGNGQNNVLNGGDGADALYGNGGDDWLEGGSGADTLLAHEGADIMFGGAGDDWIYGGTGRDEWYTGSGFDDLVFQEGDSGVGAASRDWVTDFTQGFDEIDLSSFGGLEFIGEDTFDAPDQLRYFHDGGNTVVRINTVGNSGAEMEIELNGVVNLAAGDFIL